MNPALMSYGLQASERRNRALVAFSGIRTETSQRYLTYLITWWGLRGYWQLAFRTSDDGLCQTRYGGSFG